MDKDQKVDLVIEAMLRALKMLVGALEKIKKGEV